jgi:Right handed beta helix region
MTRLMFGVVLAILLVAPSSRAAQSTGNVIRVPQDAPTVQAAVAAAAPGDTILLDRGTYPGGVTVPKAKPNLTIRGVDRNAVVFDGADTWDDAIDVLADGVTLQNLSAHNFRKNAFYWDGVSGFTGSYLTVWNVLGYGIYSEDSTDGLVEHDYVSGAADAAYYVGECKPCRTTIRNVVARLSAVGSSGTNASGSLVIRDSRWDGNGAGILPNSLADEADPPQQEALIVENTVTRNGRARVPLNTPLAGYYGIGIGVAGGNRNRVLRNTVTGSRRYGIAIFSTPYRITAPIGWRPQANSVRSNAVRGSGLADLAVSASARGGNCFRRNRAATTMPARLQRRPCRTAGGDRRVSRTLEAPFQTLMDRAIRAIRPIPYTSVPPPPPQPNRPGS